MWLQLIFNTLASASVLTLVALGFNLIFFTTRVFHLAHGIIYVLGGYVLLAFRSLYDEFSLGYWLLGLAAALCTAALVALLVERLVYYPMAQRQAGQSMTLISSIGVYLLLLNGLVLLFGNETQFLPPVHADMLVLGQLRMAPVQLYQLGVGVVVAILLLYLVRTEWFLNVRAIVSNRLVASVMGVDERRVRMLVMLLGSALVGLAGVLSIYDNGLDPYSGMQVTLTAAAAVIIGGENSLKGTILAVLALSAIQTSVEWFLSSQWKEGATFLMLIVVLLWRTEGIVSYKIRIEEK